MCGRARCTLSPGEVVQHAGLQDNNWKNQEQYQACENVCPGRSTPVVYTDRHHRRAVRTMKWGLIPSYTKPNEKLDFFRMFNARIETVSEKPAFRRLISSKRCVVLLDGFYEWVADTYKQKQPYYIHQSGRPMKMAGLYDVWKVPSSSRTHESFDRHEKQSVEDEKSVEEQGGMNEDESAAKSEFMFSYTILTTDSSSRFNAMHNRMPVLLTDEQAEAWLDETANANKLLMQFGPYNGEDLVWHPVTKKMNNLSYLDSNCAMPIKLGQARSITSFWGIKNSNDNAESKANHEDDSLSKIGATMVKDERADVQEAQTGSDQAENSSSRTAGDKHSSVADAHSSPSSHKRSSLSRSPLQSPIPISHQKTRPMKGSPSPKRQRKLASFFGK